MLILGRILLGIGVGFTNQATPVYLSELAPPRWRGAFNVGFEFFIGVGVLTANCINYISSKYTWGWRLSLGLAAVPALVMIVGALIIPDTPSSLIERGRLAEAKRVLVKIRGPEMDVETELEELVRYSMIAKATDKGAFMTIFERQYRPHLVMAIAVSFFQQVTGVSIVPFYGPVLFRTVGFKGDSALLAAIIIGSVNLWSIMASALLVDHFGRRILLLEGGIQMIICQVGLAIVLGTTMGTSGTGHIPWGYGVLVVVLMCVYAAGFGWSWGPLGILIPSEIFPMKIRMAGQGIGVAVNFGAIFVVSQTFLSMLCLFKYWAFIFYGGWIAVMTIFVMILLPETKGIPIDEMHVVWKRHWYWRRFV